MSDCLFEMCLPSHESEHRPTAGVLSAVNALMTSITAQQHLAPCLLALYGDVEQTGFYEKLEHRYKIACLLKYLWKLPHHKAAFVRISQNEVAFVKFAHGLMNHINSLLTDALSSLPEIKALQEEQQNPSIWGTFDQATQEQKQSLLAEKERTVTSSLQLANETIHMMSYLTSEIQAPFLMPALEDRLVSMLNSVLVKLAGPKGLELKVIMRYLCVVSNHSFDPVTIYGATIFSFFLSRVRWPIPKHMHFARKSCYGKSWKRFCTFVAMKVSKRRWQPMAYTIQLSTANVL